MALCKEDQHVFILNKVFHREILYKGIQYFRQWNFGKRGRKYIFARKSFCMTEAGDRIAIIGAGAAGCFCAIETKRRHPDAIVTVYEAHSTPLAKVAITGGGRCNLTNTFRDISKLSAAYPRGERLVKKAFGKLSPKDTYRWWESEGVALTVQDDQCIFPVSQDAMQVVKTLTGLMRWHGVTLKCRTRVKSITPGKAFTITFADGTTASADKVVVTTGGGIPSFVRDLGIETEKTIPSLFTFKIKDASLTGLQGTVIDNAGLSLAGTKFRSQGIMLITDWGVSGPAVLRLSSYGARYLADNGTTGTLCINWLSQSEDDIRQMIGKHISDDGRKMVSSLPPEGLTSRTWKHILNRAGLRNDIRWAEIGAKGINRLACALVSDSYKIEGKASFKEEFVTAGGVASAAVNASTLESKDYPGLYFAGEVLDIDGITGGFNLQAAWSTGYLVASSL